MAMNRENRAKQFAPFDALKGLSEALRKKEYDHERQERTERSEEIEEEISKEISKIDKKDRVRIRCFENGYYVDIIGEVKEINFIKKYIAIEEGKIFFDDIYGIKKL